MNPIYNMMMNQQRMQQVMQVMQNPIGFLVQKFPDIPIAIRGDASQILQYLQQTRGITNDQIQQTMNSMPRQF